MFRKIVLAGSAAALLATPVIASADTRSSAPVEGASELAGQATILFIAGIAAVAAAIVLLSEDDDPVSP